MILKGAAGTGKTTFALQLAEELGEVAASHYLSSRVSDESLHYQFPWLRDRLKAAAIQTGPPTSQGSKVERRALDIFEGKIEEGKEGDESSQEPVGAER